MRCHLLRQHPPPLPISTGHICICSYEPGVVERTQAWPPIWLCLSPHSGPGDKLVLSEPPLTHLSKLAVVKTHSFHHSVIQQTVREHWPGSLRSSREGRDPDLRNALELTRASVSQAEETEQSKAGKRKSGSFEELKHTQIGRRAWRGKRVQDDI